MLQNNEIYSLINQARSDAKKDAIRKFFSQNGKIVSIISVVAVVGAIGFGAFTMYQNSQEAKFSEIFHQALIDQQIGNMEKAKEGLQKIYSDSSAPKGVKSLASLRYAAVLFDENKKAEAAAIYQEINQCSSCDSYVKDLGGLLAVKTWLSDENEISKDDLLTRIERIENHSKELHYQISEQKAALYVQKNNLDKAYEILDAIVKNPEVGQTIKMRATEALKIIVAKGFTPNSEVAKLSTETQK